MGRAGRLVVDNSILSATAKCSTYAFTRYALGLATRQEALALGAGSSIHLGLAAWLDGASPGDAVRRMAEDYEERVERHLRLTERRQLGADDKRFEPAWVEAVFSQWLDRNAESWPFKVLEHTAETPVSAPFPAAVPSGRDVIYVARLDAIVRKWDSAGKWSMDHKSTKKVTDWWKDKQKTSSQFSGHLWLSRAKKGEMELEGVVANVIELPDPHRSERICPDHHLSFQECSVRHAGGTYLYITRSEPEMDGWFLTAKQLTRRYDGLTIRAEQEGIEGVRHVRMDGRFNDSCAFCELKEWCRLGRNTSKNAIRSMFVEDPWDPLAP